MRIAKVEVLEFHRTLDGRSWNPTFRWHERRAPLVVLETDSGLRGVGEAWSRQVDIDRVLAALAQRSAPVLIGGGVADARAHVARGFASAVDWVGAAAASAVDLALWDLEAQARGAPLWRTLGGRDGRVAVYASGGLYRDGATLDDLSREFAGYAEAGFTAAKAKIGALSLDDDLARVRAARRALGAEPTLWVDAVNQLDRARAPAWCDALAEAGVAAIQAPLAFDDVPGMANLTARHLPVIATEAEHRETAFAALLDAGAVSHLQYCLGLCGGPTGAHALDARAQAHGVTTTPQCFSTAVMQAASLHFAAAHRNVVTAEYHRFHDHLADLLPAAMTRIEHGYVRLDDAPGLGVAPPRIGPQSGGGEVRLHASLHR
jgi:L-alanine-DL-glutamate epimerase-like enolase superfamily enzyme